MAVNVKVLVIGSVLGSISDACEKMKSLDAKYGKFEFAICTGDFFGSTTEEDDTQLIALLEDRLTVPLPIYIMAGQHSLPLKVQEKVSETGGELCRNVFYLEQGSVLTTSHGLKIAILGGLYDSSTYSAKNTAPTRLLRFTKRDVHKLLSNSSITPLATQANTNSLAAIRAAASSSNQASKIDILLTHCYPESILRHSSSPSTPATEKVDAWLANPLDSVVEKCVPRYHFASGPGIFWEREPFNWPHMEQGVDRVTRFISLGSFGGPALSPGEKKPRWSYAFTISPLSSTSQPVSLPANVSLNPFNVIDAENGSPRSKRPHEDEDGPNFRWSGGAGRDLKRRKRDNEWEGKNQDTSKAKACRICNSNEHTVQNCPEKQKPPEGYICRKCQQPGHFIRDCPTRDELGDTGGKKPKEGYVCRACGSEKHYIDDCPVVKEQRAAGGSLRDRGRGKREAPTEIRPEDCWFCLSNPKLVKHLIVSLGEETYVTFTKGQLPISGSSEPPIQDLFPVPGGGQALIVPITHHPTLLGLPDDEKDSVSTEVTKYKSALRGYFGQYGASPVFFEIAKRRMHAVHAHLQCIPVPISLVDQVEPAFVDLGKRMGFDFNVFQEATNDVKDNYFYLEFTDNQDQTKRLIHVMHEDGDTGQRRGEFPLQFGRMALASVFNMPERIDWKNCALSESREREDVAKFKAGFQGFDPSL